MSTRKWKGSQSVRRRTDESSSVNSTTSSASTVSVANLTLESSDDHLFEGGSTKSLASSTREKPCIDHSVDSSNSSISSMGTYSYAFMRSPNEGAIPGKGVVGKRQPQSPFGTPLSTLNESIDENEDSFLETFLRIGDEKRRNEEDPNQKHSSNKYIGFFLDKCPPLRTVVALVSKLTKRRDQNTTPSMYNRYKNKTKIQGGNKRLMMVFKVLGFISLVLIAYTSLKTAATNQPDLLSPSAPNARNFKQKLLRRHKDSNSGRIENTKYSQHQFRLQAIHKGIRIPPVFLNLGDIDEQPMGKDRSIPFFWHIPRSAGTSMNNILGNCIKLSLASSYGRYDDDEKLEKLFLGETTYVNVEMSSIKGIERAKKLNLASSGLADVIISSRIYEASFVFSPTHRGRLFTFMRHPIERAVSLFHYTQDMQWRRGNVANLMDITMEEYFKGGMGENNWMTRFLSNQRARELIPEDLDVAKEVLRRKCLVGLLTDKGESMTRFIKYFGWEDLINKGEEETRCLERKLDYAWPMKHRHDEVEEGSDLWNLVVKYNVYDLQLYDYAKVLFREQASLFH